MTYSYGPHPKQVLDVYKPSGPGPFPVLVYIHGGGWRQGNQTLRDGSFPRRFEQRGYAIVSVDHRWTTQARWPAQLDDVTAAVQWVRDNADAQGFDVSTLTAWGASSGGHLAMMLGQKVDQVINFYGPSDLLELQNDLDGLGCPLFQGYGMDDPRSPVGRLLGDAPSAVPDLARAASPITHVCTAPRTMIVHGQKDCSIPWTQSQRYADATGSEIHLVSDGGHGVGILNRTTFDYVARFLGV